ncbi:MAG: GGDEF domain-containing protein [Saccharofermentanales bacterium]
MKKRVILLFLAMISLGALFGLILYWAFISISQNLLAHCVLMGCLFGLVNAFVALLFIKKYSEVRINNKKLSLALRKDKLTGLYNRQAFDSDIRMELESNCSMIFLDMDDFSDFNNTYGHQVGDRMLIAFADITKNRIRQSDSAYRYGGEEIVVILHGCDKLEATRIAQSIVDGLRNHDNSPYQPITVSAGVASMPEDAQSFDHLINASDSAMLEAKKTGKNQVVIFENRK